MKPRTKIEKEVARLSCGLSCITPAQERWALEHCTDMEYAYKRSRNHNDIQHFIVITVCKGWQVMRHYYIYSHFAYKKLKSHTIAEVMQQWFKAGEYVFLARNRRMGWADDGWQLSQPMSIKRGYGHCWCLSDPRCLGYTAVYYAKLGKPFSYLPKDTETHLHIGDIYRAVNASPFCETLLRSNFDILLWCIKNSFAFDREKMAAVKIAMRYKYNFLQTDWEDLVRMLEYLGKDLHNPSLVCPQDFNKMHDKVSKMASNKRKRRANKMYRLQEIRQEKQRLRHLEEQQEREKQQKERAKGLATTYERKRAPFFGLHLQTGNLTIDPLRSVQEFFEEGKELNHCVFANAYYDVNTKPNCLILSAKVDGVRAETIEVDISDYSIRQCRGKFNQDSPYHSQILELMEYGMKEVRNCAKRQKKRSSPTSHV